MAWPSLTYNIKMSYFKTLGISDLGVKVQTSWGCKSGVQTAVLPAGGGGIAVNQEEVQWTNWKWLLTSPDCPRHMGIKQPLSLHALLSLITLSFLWVLHLSPSQPIFFYQFTVTTSHRLSFPGCPALFNCIYFVFLSPPERL